MMHLPPRRLEARRLGDGRHWRIVGERQAGGAGYGGREGDLVFLREGLEVGYAVDDEEAGARGPPGGGGGVGAKEGVEGVGEFGEEGGEVEGEVGVVFVEGVTWSLLDWWAEMVRGRGLTDDACCLAAAMAMAGEIDLLDRGTGRRLHDFNM